MFLYFYRSVILGITKFPKMIRFMFLRESIWVLHNDLIVQMMLIHYFSLRTSLTHLYLSCRLFMFWLIDIPSSIIKNAKTVFRNWVSSRAENSFTTMSSYVYVFLLRKPRIARSKAEHQVNFHKWTWAKKTMRNARVSEHQFSTAFILH